MRSGRREKLFVLDMKMRSCIGLYILLILHFFQISSVFALTDPSDASALRALRSELTRSPDNWTGSDPCGTKWVGVDCRNSNRVYSISLGNLNLEGKLPAEITSLSELEILDFTSNPKLNGPLPLNIGYLKKLTTLNLAECGFTGPIPESIGDLGQLSSLSLNSNKFSGTIPASIGRLSKLSWFDIADNQIEGTIPVSNGALSPGLDMLLEAQHFHFGNNKLSGDIPEQLFTSNMTLIHILFDGNQLTGKIPDSLSLVRTLTVLRLDRNKLIGDIPSSLNNLTSLYGLYLGNNRFTGKLPNLSNLNSLSALDVSNNTLEYSVIPSWISSLSSLSTLRMENIHLEGRIPDFLFSLDLLQTVTLKDNQLNETLNFGTNYSRQLEYVDLQYNEINEYNQIIEYKPPTNQKVTVILADNPVCKTSPQYCKEVQDNITFSVPNITCPPCGHDKEPSLKCECVFPLMGELIFRAPLFSGFSNNTNFIMLQKGLSDLLITSKSLVESVAIRNIRDTEIEHKLLVEVLFFPLSKEGFDETTMNSVISVFSNHIYKPPPIFGPYVFNASSYPPFSGGGSKSTNIGIIIIASVVGVVVLLVLLTIAGIYAYKQKKKAERATDQNNPFAKWNKSKNNVDAPQLMGAKAFTFEELKKCTENFSKANDVGGGGYGQVYKGILPSGQLLAIKRAQQGSSQGELEFKTEIELLSRVHHKNVVRLLGFCFDGNEQMLVYEYIQNGSLTDSLSGKSGIVLDWPRRLKIALGSGKGLAYLHEHAYPPIIHRDIKSNNILLDETLTAKVADFGLSKLVGDNEKMHMTTQVKGTMGYLDPEYYMTNQLTEKSDVYGFGVVMLELLTGKSPIVGGKYVVKEMKTRMDKSKRLYDLQELLDTSIITSSNNLKGFDKYVDLALRCVEVEGVNRPSMGEVVKEIENIMQLEGLNPNVDSTSTSLTYDYASKGSGDPYENESFKYSGNFPYSKLEPL